MAIMCIKTTKMFINPLCGIYEQVVQAPLPKFLFPDSRLAVVELISHNDRERPTHSRPMGQSRRDYSGSS
jgi:hypothetical protein